MFGPECFVVTFRRGDAVLATEYVFADRKSRAVIKATVRQQHLPLDEMTVDVAPAKRAVVERLRTTAARKYAGFPVRYAHSDAFVPEREVTSA